MDSKERVGGLSPRAKVGQCLIFLWRGSLITHSIEGIINGLPCGGLRIEPFTSESARSIYCGKTSNDGSFEKPPDHCDSAQNYFTAKRPALRMGPEDYAGRLNRLPESATSRETGEIKQLLRVAEDADIVVATNCYSWIVADSNRRLDRALAETGKAVVVLTNKPYEADSPPGADTVLCTFGMRRRITSRLARPFFSAKDGRGSTAGRQWARCGFVKFLSQRALFAFIMLLWAADLAGDDGMSGGERLLFSSLFDSGMVLQRDRPIPVSGKARSGAEVVVRFNGEAIRGRADARGDWCVSLSPHEASEKPHRLRVESEGEAIDLENVLIGDVWLLSGQSNMARGFREGGEWVVDRGEDFLSSLADENLRLIRIDTPATDVPMEKFDAAWVEADYGTYPEELRSFSATGLYFGAVLRKEADIPIGLIQAANGGTKIENWLPQGALRDLRPEILDRPHTGKPRHLPAGQYNAKIHPLRGLPIRGILFYQGEGNVGDEDYGRMFRRLIGEWRAAWDEPELLFVFAQLANWTDDGSFTPPLEGRRRSAKAELREAQRSALSLPSTAMVTLIDIMNSVPDDQRGGFVHPCNKAETGRRFAMEALRLVYGRKDFAAVPHPVAAARIRGGVVRIHFAPCADGLALIAGDRPEFFTVAGPDGEFREADAEIVGDREIEVSCRAVRNPQRVRYAWADNPTLAVGGRPEKAANLVSVSDPPRPVAPFELEVAEPPP